MNFRSLALFIFFLNAVLISFAQSGTTVVDSITSGGIWRKYRLYVPAVYNGSSARPLIFNFHGLGSNALQQQVYGNFQAIADTANFLVVHPEGTSQFGSQFWNVGVFAAPNDVGFTLDLLDSLKRIYNINPQQVYTTGMSNGAIMSYYLVCQAPNTFAAMASVAGTQLRAWFNSCNPLKAVPVLEIHGDADATVPYNGASNAIYGSFVPIDSVMLKWRTHNQCNAQASITAVPDVVTSDGCTATNYKWLQGIENSSVELYKITNGSHSWPGAPPVFAQTNLDFNASAEIWRFFRNYKLNQFNQQQSIAQLQLAQKVSVFPNPTSSFIQVQMPETAVALLFDASGKIVMNLQTGKTSVELLQNGLYFVKITDGGNTYTLKLSKQ